jgi:flagellar motor switch protein FliG
MTDDSLSIKKMTGAEKSAVILLSIDEEQASKIIAMMNDEEIKEISSAMSSLGSIKPELAEQLVSEFSTEISGASSFVGNVDTTERLLERVLDKDRTQLIMEEIRGPAGKNTWDKLGNVNEGVLATYLKNEYPQTVALIMSKMSSSHAAKVFTSFPDDFAIDVMMRMLSMEPVKKEILEKVEKTLKNEFITTLTKTQKYDSNQVIAEIFNNLDRANESKFMHLLEKRTPEQAEKIKELMFTFVDLLKIDSAGIQAVLRVVDKNKLTVALKGADEALKDLFIKNMSQRAAKILLEDIASLGPVRLKDVDEAQASIVLVAKGMAAKGEIIINTTGEEDMVY